ncbi:Vacuolar inheritance and morphology protein [Neurospora sp. IMI 360204]|nr:Vacuolar inheritance and morphology protein [Neurospora sp. IMI 360204]
MDKSPNITTSKRSQIPTTAPANPQKTVTHAGQQAHAQAQTAAPSSNPLPTLSRESTSSSAATVNPRTDSWPSKLTSQTSATSASSVSRASSVAPSPFASREPSPTRPLNRAHTTHNTTAASSRAPSRGPPAAGGAVPRSRNNSLQDPSPSRSTRPGSISLSTTGSRTLSSATTPTFLPAATDRNVNAPAPPSKSPTAQSQSHSTGSQDPLKWPVSSRLRSPPPILTKPPILGPPRRQDQTPDISPSTALPRQTPSFSASESQSDTDADDLTPTQPGARTPVRAAGGSTSILETVQEVSPFGSPRAFEQSMEEKLGHRLMSESTVPSDLGEFSRQREVAGRSNSTMTESGAEDATPIEAVRRSGSTSAPPLTSRQSSTSVRPPAKGKLGEGSQQSMTVEAETVTSIPQVALAPGVGVQPSSLSLRTKPSTETIRPPKKEKKRTARKQPNMTSGTASSKADIFEAKVASAIEETNSSDSDETFVYDSNPPDHPRPPRYHSRTPSAASIVSQLNRTDMRSIHPAMMNQEQPIGVKRSMKFVNSYNPSINESVGAEEDGKSTTGRSTAGSARGTLEQYDHHAIGFMFATSQPLTDIELISMDHVVASEQELMLDLTIRAKNPNVVVVVVDAADIEVFAKSPHAGTDSEWYRTHPGDMPPLESSKEEVRISKSGDLVKILDDPPNDQPPEESSPNMRLGTITGFNSALTFEGSFFHQGLSTSMGEVRLKNPGNVTVGGTERWERIIADDFQLIIKGVLKYTLPLSQRVRTAAISGKTTVKANAANDRDPRKPPEQAKPIEDVGGGGGRIGGDDNDHDDVSISFQ